MGKHYTIAFKLQLLQPILKGKMSIREAARFYNIPSDALVGTWLKRFGKSGIKGLIPYKSSGRPPMKPKYARMPPPPKTEFLLSTASYKVCRGKETVWIMPQWRVSLDD